MFDPDKKCPLLNKKCLKHDCQWYIMLQGRHPQTGVPIDEWGCSVAWLPLLMVEVAQESRQGAAATENFRNIMFRLAKGENPLEIEKSSYQDGVKKIGS